MVALRIDRYFSTQLKTRTIRNIGASLSQYGIPFVFVDTGRFNQRQGEALPPPIWIPTSAYVRGPGSAFLDLGVAAVKST